MPMTLAPVFRQVRGSKSVKTSIRPDIRATLALAGHANGEWLLVKLKLQLSYHGTEAAYAKF